MEKLLLPRTLIVVNVIFGKALKDKGEFRAGDVEELVVADSGPSNAAKVLDRLLGLKWLTVRVLKETTTRGGRGPRFTFTRERPKGS